MDVSIIGFFRDLELKLKFKLKDGSSYTGYVVFGECEFSDNKVKLTGIYMDKTRGYLHEDWDTQSPEDFIYMSSIKEIRVDEQALPMERLRV